MNAAIRAVVRVAHSKGIQVIGFERGWDGLMYNNFRIITPRSVSGIIQFGGTMLHTCRCPYMETEEGLKKAADYLSRNNIEGLVVIGGDGSFRAARDLSKYSDTIMAGIPATIDNDVYGTDETIGFDTAVNTAVGEIDKIRDTARSHDRIFIVEVMGRKRGFLASFIGLTVGAEIVLVPEISYDREHVFKVVNELAYKGKRSGIIVAAEGIGDTRKLAEDIEANTGTEARLSILGYAQRGGHPTARSRFLASVFGEKAVNILVEKKENAVAVLQSGNVTSISLEESCNNKKVLNKDILTLTDILAG